MTGWLFLIGAVTASTLLWPVSRWGLRGTGRPVVVGFWTSLAMGAISLGGCLARGELRAPPQVWLAGCLMALAYAVGFWTLVMHCLKIGPAGPTVTVNNMAMVCGVLYGVLYLHPSGIPNALITSGAAGTCVALVLIGMAKRTRRADVAPVPRRWFPMLIAGGAFSGLSFMTQTYIGEAHSSFHFAFLAIGALGSALLLLPTMLLRHSLPGRVREIAAGIGVGVLSGIGILLTLAAFEHLSSAIVLPFSVTTPVLLMLLIGHFAYREHLDPRQWAGSLVGALSVLLLALGSRG